MLNLNDALVLYNILGEYYYSLKPQEAIINTLTLFFFLKNILLLNDTTSASSDPNDYQI